MGLPLILNGYLVKIVILYFPDEPSSNIGIINSSSDLPPDSPELANQTMDFSEQIVS